MWGEKNSKAKLPIISSFAAEKESKRSTRKRV